MKTRAEFDAKTKTDLTEYERTKLQSELDISVKMLSGQDRSRSHQSLLSHLGLIVAADLVPSA